MLGCLLRYLGSLKCPAILQLSAIGSHTYQTTSIRANYQILVVNAKQNEMVLLKAPWLHPLFQCLLCCHLFEISNHLQSSPFTWSAPGTLERSQKAPVTWKRPARLAPLRALRPGIIPPPERRQLVLFKAWMASNFETNILLVDLPSACLHAPPSR